MDWYFSDKKTHSTIWTGPWSMTHTNAASGKETFITQLANNKQWIELNLSQRKVLWGIGTFLLHFGENENVGEEVLYQ